MVETQVKKHILSKKLPVDLDNRLYSLTHLIGGLSFRDVIKFVDNASFDQVTELQNKVNNFPSTTEEIMPYLGGLSYLRDSKEYGEILDLILNPVEQNLYEHVEVDSDGKYTTDTNPYFTEYITPEIKKILFKIWDGKGEVNYSDLKLVGVESAELYPDTSFANVPDIIMPVLMIEWLGGIENTDFGKNKDEMSISQQGAPPIKFRLDPTGFDYSFDESGNFGGAGYSCWHIKVSIDKNSLVTDTYINRYNSDSQNLKWENYVEDNVFTPVLKISELFLPSYLNKEMSFREYTDHQMELIEIMWESYDYLACEQFCSFCNVEVVLV